MKTLWSTHSIETFNIFVVGGLDEKIPPSRTLRKKIAIIIHIDSRMNNCSCHCNYCYCYCCYFSDPSLLTKQSLRSTPSMPPLDILQTHATLRCPRGACFTSNSLESSSMRSRSDTDEISDNGLCFCADMEEGESKLFKRM